MKNIKLALTAVLLALLLLWWLGDPAADTLPANWLGWRNLLVQATGVLAIGAMSLALVLALRPVALEPWLGGLDKMYRLHKWLGIAALPAAIAHWLLANGPKWLVGAGLVERPQRGPRPALPEGSLQQALAQWRGLAEDMGEWAFYAAVVLIVLALWKRFPYRTFLRTHRWLGLAYLVLAFHSVVLLTYASWAGVLGIALGAMLLAGSFAAVRALLRRVGVDRRVVGEIAKVIRHDALDVVELVVALQGRWPGHAAGQFAFLTLDRKEGAHPFTITSAWAGDGRIDFVIKGIGDYTRTLRDRVHVGDPVVVEGPYGRFDFESSAGRQVWIGAGVGITPFIARMKALAMKPDGRRIDLFHPTATLDPHAIALIERDAAAAGVALHVLWDERDGRLDAARLAAAVPDWRDADVWFCGPAPFGRALRHDLEAMGLPAGRFHQELFEMR